MATKKPKMHPLAQYISHILVDIEQTADDTKLFNQLQTDYSSHISRFPSWSMCPYCFIEKYDLEPEIVKNIYTGKHIFTKLNMALCNETVEAPVRMYTQLLADSVYNIRERLPEVVYRGVEYSDSLAHRYKKYIGKVVYYYSFTSASRHIEQADRFGRDREGWLLKIGLEKGNRGCVADVSGESIYPSEAEILISCNAGFEIDDVDTRQRIIELVLVDEEHCLKQKPEGKVCYKHS